jgi:ferrous iron transport protein A
MSLDCGPLGRRYRVMGVRSGSALSHRLMELGIVEGAEIEVVRRAPLGDPVQLRVGDYELSLRSSEARLIDVADA